MMRNNSIYFNKCEQQKLQWLSLFLQWYLANANGKEIEEKQMFADANSAWYAINSKDPLFYDEFDLVLRTIIEYRTNLNLSIKRSKGWLFFDKFKTIRQRLLRSAKDIIIN